MSHQKPANRSQNSVSGFQEETRNTVIAEQLSNQSNSTQIIFTLKYQEREPHGCTRGERNVTAICFRRVEKF